MTTAEQIAAAYPQSASVAHALVALGRLHGVDPAHFANIINFESRWNTKARNRASGATGLIQFMPKTAAALGTTTDAIQNMTASEQIALVARFFARQRGKLKSKYDVYMAVFYPAYIGQPENTLFPAQVQRANPGIKTPADYAAKVEGVARLVPGSGGSGALSLAPTPSTSGEPGTLAERRQQLLTAEQKRQLKKHREREYQRKLITFVGLSAIASALVLFGINRELKRRIY